MNQELLQAIDEASEKWMNIDGVEGVADGEREGKLCIVVFTSVDPSELAGRLPTTFKGFSVVFEQTGEISAE